MALRTLISRSSSSLSPLISARAFASSYASPPFAARAAPLLRLRPLAFAVGAGWPPAEVALGGGATRCFSTRPTTSSLNDPSPNWSNRPPKETILLDGCDFEHWLVVMEPPAEETTRDEIIDSYIKTLAQVVGSEEEARMKIYSVSTKHYFAFGALVSEELSNKIKDLPRVRWVLPDSYLDVKNKDYGGEPFIDGKAVPYDPKYHEEWVRNNARANERSRRNDRPRNFDRSRNFERRRENMQNRDFQNRVPSPMPNQQFQSSEVQNPLPPRDMPPGPTTHGSMPPVPPPGNVPPSPGGMTSNVLPNVQYSNREAAASPNPAFQGTPNRDYQNQGPGYQGNYVPNTGGGNMPGSDAYRGAVHQGGSGPYQGSSSVPRGVANAYQGGGGPYQSGGTGYQGGGGGGYPGGGNAYQGGGGPYQGGGTGYQGGGGGGYPGGNAYQGGGGPYQGGGTGYQGGGGGGYPGGGNAYQGGGGPYQGSGNACQGAPEGHAYQGGDGSFQSGGNPHQGRDMPGRD